MNLGAQRSLSAAPHMPLELGPVHRGLQGTVSQIAV